MVRSAQNNDVIGVEIDLTLEEGRSLVARDGGGILGMGKAKSSDPYVIVKCGQARHGMIELGRTNVVKKTLNPAWKQTFKFHLEGRKFRTSDSLVLAVYDFDTMSADDPMGEVALPLSALLDGRPIDRWYPVANCRGCSDAKGELHCKISVLLRRALSLEAKQALPLQGGGRIAIALGWDLLPGNRAIDLDVACVAVDVRGRVVMQECVYFAQLLSKSGALRHTGDEKEGDEDLGAGDDEIVLVDLPRVPGNICALHFIACVASEDRTFADVKTARLRAVEWTSGLELCRFVPGTVGAHTALFFARIGRPAQGQASAWTLTAIGEADHTARDWGSLIPEVQMYTQDLVPGLQVDMSARVAMMRKGGVVRLSDYWGKDGPPASVTCGLYWDVTNGVNIDLDASAILLDASLSVVDVVWFKQLASRDGSIVHGGDEREGDEVGDDEKIVIDLRRVHPAVAHIFFVINSYSGQELDDVKDAGCHIFDSGTRRDFARFEMTDTAFLDKHTALLVGELFRDDASAEWAFEIASVASTGRTVMQNVPAAVSFLRSRAARVLPPPRLPPGGGSFLMRHAASPTNQPTNTRASVAVPTHAELPMASVVPAGPVVVEAHAAPPVPGGRGRGRGAQLPVAQPVAQPAVQMAGQPVAHLLMGEPVETATPRAPSVPAAGGQSGGGGGGSALEKLKELKGMLDLDLVTKEEFDAKKAQLLQQM